MVSGNGSVKKNLKYRHVVFCINSCHYIWFVYLEIIDNFCEGECRGFLGRAHSPPCIYFALRLFCDHLFG